MISLSNTLQLPSQADHVLYCSALNQLDLLHQRKAWGGLPRYILGTGSNVVLPEYLEGAVIQVALRGVHYLREDPDAHYISASAGENWHHFVMTMLNQGFNGLENLALIPGTVGAAPIQNIGAYGVEVKQYIDHLKAYELLTGKLHVFTNEECQFAYRDSLFKSKHPGQFLITEVVFRLPKVATVQVEYGEIKAELAAQQLSPTPSHIAKAVIAIRRRKLPDPAEIGNAGSFFKNPIVTKAACAALLNQFPTMPHYPIDPDHHKLAAGWLIEQAGWKGKRLGPVGMYDKQALVLVNHGGATAADVKALCLAVQRDVYQRFTIQLEPEPSFW